VIHRSRAVDAVALATLIIVVVSSCYGYWRLARWRDAQERTRAAEIRRCKAACERPQAP
jgi:hypothetical protein